MSSVFPLAGSGLSETGKGRYTTKGNQNMLEHGRTFHISILWHKSATENNANVRRVFAAFLQVSRSMLPLGPKVPQFRPQAAERCPAMLER